jgi:hypothetical protein
MGWLLLVVIALVAFGVWVVGQQRQRGRGTSFSAPTRSPAPSTRPPQDRQREFEREWEAEIQRLLPEVEAEAEAEFKKMQAEIDREVALDLTADEEMWAGDEEEPDSADEQPVLRRADFVPKDREAQYLTRDMVGLPTLRLVDAGDRLAIWSPINDGALINPKGPGLRQLGLYASYARGSDHYRAAFKAADLGKGCWVDLHREPDNPHDKNAVAMSAPGRDDTLGYVQKARAPAVARRMDAGEDMAAVSMRGPGRGRGDEAAFLLIGSRTDLEAMLRAG